MVVVTFCLNVLSLLLRSRLAILIWLRVLSILKFRRRGWVKEKFMLAPYLGLNSVTSWLLSDRSEL